MTLNPILEALRIARGEEIKLCTDCRNERATTEINFPCAWTSHYHLVPQLCEGCKGDRMDCLKERGCWVQS